MANLLKNKKGEPLWMKLAVPGCVSPMGWDKNVFKRTLVVGDDFSLVRKALLRVFSEEEMGLILKIEENNTDPTVRLVYADWLEEHGRMDEAEAERQAADVVGKYEAWRKIQK